MNKTTAGADVQNLTYTPDFVDFWSVTGAFFPFLFCKWKDFYLPVIYVFKSLQRWGDGGGECRPPLRLQVAVAVRLIESRARREAAAPSCRVEGRD